MDFKKLGEQLTMSTKLEHLANEAFSLVPKVNDLLGVRFDILKYAVGAVEVQQQPELWNKRIGIISSELLEALEPHLNSELAIAYRYAIKCHFGHLLNAYSDCGFYKLIGKEAALSSIPGIMMWYRARSETWEIYYRCDSEQAGLFITPVRPPFIKYPSYVMDGEIEFPTVEEAIAYLRERITRRNKISIMGENGDHSTTYAEETTNGRPDQGSV